MIPSTRGPRRLALVTSHPVQYYAPWFRALARRLPGSLRVFYLWQNQPPDRPPGIDREFGRTLRWDCDLLGGYEHEFVANTAAEPGTHHFHGLRNPALPDRLRAHTPDAVLLLGYGWNSPLRLALTWRDCPLILRGDSHDLGRSPGARSLLRTWTLRALFTRFTAFAAVGTANRAHYLRHGVPPGRIFQVPHCVDNHAFATAADPAAALAWRRALGVPDRHRLVGFAGKLVRKKRPDLLLRAFARLAAPDTSLVFIGDGALAPELHALAAARAPSTPVHFVPLQNQSAMPPALAALDLLVLPSEGPGETWGLVVNEAMAVGVPALVSTHVGCRADLIVEGVTGWSFPAGDESALTATLARALAALAARPDTFRAATRAHLAACSPDAAAAAFARLLDALPAPPASSPP